MPTSLNWAIYKTSGAVSCQLPLPLSFTWLIHPCRVGLGSLFQNPTQISGQTQPTKVFDPIQPIIDTWYGILGYTENFIQQLLHVTDKFTVRS